MTGGQSAESSNGSSPLELNKKPRGFAGENLEQLIDQGVLPKKDEAKLGNNTVLRLDVNMGLTITHENIDYRISSANHSKIGDLDFYRYATQRGEEFLHIPAQGKLVPPTEMTWYAYPPNTEVYLDKKYKHKLLETAVKKAGGIVALRHELKRNGTRMNAMYVYKQLNDLRKGMTEDKLIPILNYLGRNLDEASNHIYAIGHIQAVKDPQLPFNLSGKDGARLLSARYGDGTLCASVGRGPRFDYSNNDTEMRDRVIESLTNVFGEPNVLNREHSDGRVSQVRTSSDIIGHALQRAGAITGEIVNQNPHVPTWIEQGSIENKREWIVQAFGDEGFVWANRGKVCIGRSVELTSVLLEHMSRHLDQMDWGSRYIDDVFVDDVRACDDLPADITQAIREHPINLLVEEKKMLEDFGIVTEMYPSEIHRGKYGDYSAHWTLQAKTREDTRRFYEEIGFPQERKQEDLRSAIRFER
ncbi:MAG: hypothetical protein WED04_03210 [Promethearchaeati archaeon SRVP18_Atabeyarchaeia-1]